MRVGIVGLGQIGTSIGLGLKLVDRVSEVIGLDRLAEHAESAEMLGAVHRVANDLEELADVDVLFLTTPPSVVLTLLDRLDELEKPPLTTDVASLKKPMADWIAQDPRRAAWFVPGHPMAGRDGSGPASARTGIFWERQWFLCPHRSTPKSTVARVSVLLEGLGAKVMPCDADLHDHAMARVSHVPNILANVLEWVAAGYDAEFKTGGSWRDVTRLSGNNPELWGDILCANAEPVGEALDALIEHLTGLRKALAEEDIRAVQELWRGAALIRERRDTSCS